MFFDLTQDADVSALEALLAEEPKTKIIDTYHTQLEELLLLEKPELYDNKEQRAAALPTFIETQLAGRALHEGGKWVYFAWRNALMHVVDDADYQRIRTARNRELITDEEQQQFYNSTVGIAGLSVGNSVALALVQSGGAKRLRLADPDTLELSNLNRIRGSIADMTDYKVYMTARQIYELDPYAELTLYTDGITDENIGSFMDGLDVAIDEMDDIARKMRLRMEAKQRKIPVLMATDNGDSGLLDIERYDEDESVEPFHGKGPKGPPPPEPPPRQLMGAMIAKDFVGLETTEPRMFDSIEAIGSGIPTWPQLGTAAWLNAVATTFATRCIVTGQPLINDRAVMSVPSWLVPNYNDPAEQEKREQRAKKFVEDILAR